MGPIYLFDAASRVNSWLTARQSAIAENVANANTPGFKAQDVAPFESVLDTMNLTMATPNPGHLALTPSAYARAETRPDEAAESLVSGNTVSLEKEMIKSSEVNRSYSLNTSIVKAFHRMLLASSKG